LRVKGHVSDGDVEKLTLLKRRLAYMNFVVKVFLMCGAVSACAPSLPPCAQDPAFLRDMERGKALFLEQRYPRARIAFVHGRGVCPTDRSVIAWMDLAGVAAAAEAPDLITDGNINEIDYVAETLADQFPESRHLVSTARANVLARAGKNAEALELYRTALTIKPDFVPALFFQAQLLVGMDRPADAEAVLRTATKAKPGHVGSQELLARLLAKRGSLEDARDILRTSIASNPAASTHVLQAEVARLLKRPDDALAEYKAALALRSDHAPALAGLAALLLDQNNTAAALPILAEYLEVAAAQGEPPARIAEIRRVATQLAQVPAETPPGNAAPTGKR